MSRKTILIVDDSKFDRTLLAKALARKSEFTTLQAKSGEECLELLKIQKIDLILMDIMMPGVFGTQVLIQIREQFNPIELPIIMVTSKSETSDLIGCLQSGANDYITKPVNFDVALSRISTHLKLAEVSYEMSKLKEMAALDALIVTYNHEINSPLGVAIGCLEAPVFKNQLPAEKLKSSLWRIVDVIKKIREVTDKKEAQYTDYSKFSKMIKIK